MALMSSLILAGCASFATGNPNTACTKAAQAGAQQSGIEQRVDNYERKQDKYFQKLANDLFGKENVKIMGGTFFLANSIVTRSAFIRLPTFGLPIDLNAQLNSQESLLKFDWNF